MWQDDPPENEPQESPSHEPDPPDMGVTPPDLEYIKEGMDESDVERRDSSDE